MRACATLRAQKCTLRTHSITRPRARSELWGVTLPRLPGDGELEARLAEKGLACLASGKLPSVKKYYFFGVGRGTGALVMAEATVSLDSKRLSAVLKTENASDLTGLLLLLRQALPEGGSG